MLGVQLSIEAAIRIIKIISVKDKTAKIIGIVNPTDQSFSQHVLTHIIDPNINDKTKVDIPIRTLK
jgi:hypothetical protein